VASFDDTVVVRSEAMISATSWWQRSLLSAILVAVVFMPAARGQRVGSPQGKKHALLVGVDRYGKGTLLPGLGDAPRMTWKEWRRS
jgi:hypothetical protein